MASFTPSKKTANDFNNGNEYVNQNTAQGITGDSVQAETINNLVESALWSQQEAEQAIATSENANTKSDTAVNTAQTALDRINAAISGTNLTVEQAINIFYPIGSHYIQFNGELTPAEMFGGTTWEIDTTMQGRSIIGSGGDYTLGATGGSADAVIVKHRHNKLIYIPTNTELGWLSSISAGQSGGIGVGGNPVGVEEVGVDGTGKNMPPYAVVNYWKRTA